PGQTANSSPRRTARLQLRLLPLALRCSDCRQKSQKRNKDKKPDHELSVAPGRAHDQPSENPCLLSGKDRKRVSVAAKMALATAGISVIGPTSPVPLRGRALLLIRCTSTSGISNMRRI